MGFRNVGTVVDPCPTIRHAVGSRPGTPYELVFDNTCRIYAKDGRAKYLHTLDRAAYFGFHGPTDDAGRVERDIRSSDKRALLP